MTTLGVVGTIVHGSYTRIHANFFISDFFMKFSLENLFECVLSYLTDKEITP